jgi:hypothetical protein
MGAVVAYRGLSRYSPNLGGSNLAFNRVFAFSDTVTFNTADFGSPTQDSGMLYLAVVILAHNGSSHTFSWPPSGKTSRVAAANTAGNRGIYIADKLDVDPPISSQNPGGITYSHSGGTFQDWDSFTYFFRRYKNKQVVS